MRTMNTLKNKAS